MDVKTFEKRMTWLVYMIGALISGHSNNTSFRNSTSNSKDNENEA